ncbi:MAG: hypothetical protein AMXMBFR13_29460 [Phycisphaerae bacterium]
MKNLLGLILLVGIGLATPGCEDREPGEGTAEHIGKEIDKTADQVGEKVKEDIAPAVREGIEDAGDKIEDATDRVAGEK